MIAFLFLLIVQILPPFERLTIEDGLSQNMVLDLHQDRQGFLWIATKDGLNVYDGLRFKVFRNVPGDTTSLANNVVNRVWEHPDGSIWMVTNGGGLHRMDIRTETFTRIRPPEVDAVWSTLRYSNSITGNEHTVWISSSAAGIYRYQLKTGRMEPFELWNSRHLDANVKEVRMDAAGNVWIVSAKGFFFYDAVKNKLIEDLNQPALLRANDLKVIDDSTAWALTYYGYYKIGRRDGKLVRLHSSPDDASIRLNGIAIGHHGTVWLGGLENLTRFDSDGRGKTTVAEVDVRLTSAMVVDRSGIVWIGTAGWGLLKYNPNRQGFTSASGNPIAAIHQRALNRVETLFPVNRDDRGAALTMVLVDSKQRVWVMADYYNLAVYDPATDQAREFRAGRRLSPVGASRRFSQIVQSKDGRIWLAGPGGLYLLDEPSDKVDFFPIPRQFENLSGKPDITALYVDQSGMFWIGTPDQGLARFDSKSRRLQWYRTAKTEDVLSILSDPIESDRYLWIGTEGGGLNRLDLASETFRHFGLREGLPSMVVYGMLTDDVKHIWFSSNHGLSRFNPKDFSIRNFDVSDRLQGNEFNRNEYVKLADGTLVFGGVNGYTMVDPSKVHLNMQLPNVVLTDFRISNKPVPRTVWMTTNSDPIRLRHDQRMITFEFAALEFSAPERNRYRYRMIGYDRDWVDARFSPTATYTNLPPQKYVFHVQASNNDGIWNDIGLQIPLNIEPPFWMTWWFRSLLGLFLIGSLVSAYRWRIRQMRRETQRMEEVSRLLIQRQEEERSRFAQEMHDGLGQELLVIKQWVSRWAKNSSQEEETTHYSDLSNQISAILKSVKNITYNLRPPELDRIGLSETVRYLIEESCRAADIAIDLDIEDVDVYIASEHHINVLRIMQEMVSNSIRHSKATHIQVGMFLENGIIRIQYSDDGIGFKLQKLDAPTGLGFSGMSERVRILGGSLSIHSAAGQGVSITIQIPIHERIDTIGG